MNTTSLESGAARRQAVRPAPWADVLTRRTEAFWASTYYFPTMVLLTAAGLLTGHVVWGAAALIMVCAWLLAFCSDFMAAICPFMMIFPLATLEYKNLYVFVPCVPLVFFLIAGFLVHMVRWPLTIEVGPSGRGLTLTALAVTLGGLGTISAVDYLSLTSLYYVGALGIGMLVAYVVVYSAMSGIHVRTLQEFTVRLLYTLGFAMVLTVVAFYMQNWHLLQSRTIPELIYRNFVATILVTTLPAVFYMARSGRRHLLSVGLWALAMFFSGSRSALLFGGVMLLLGLVWLILFFSARLAKRDTEKKKKWNRRTTVGRSLETLCCSFLSADGTRPASSTPMKAGGGCCSGGWATFYSTPCSALVLVQIRTGICTRGLREASAHITTPLCRWPAAWG